MATICRLLYSNSFSTSARSKTATAQNCLNIYILNSYFDRGDGLIYVSEPDHSHIRLSSGLERAAVT
jgi:hypothetical protein